MPSSKGFKLAGGDAEFNDRQKQLFDQLFDAEKSFHKDQDASTSEFHRSEMTSTRKSNFYHNYFS